MCISSPDPVQTPAAIERPEAAALKATASPVTAAREKEEKPSDLPASCSHLLPLEKTEAKVSPSRYEAIARLDVEENEEENWAGEMKELLIYTYKQCDQI